MSTQPKKQLVLIVEDDSDIVRIISVALEREGYAVATADNAITALEIVTESAVDLIITDVMMPGVDGLQLVKVLKNDQRTCNIPVLIMSARTSESDILAGAAAGAESYFGKPFSTSELVESVNEKLAA